MKKVPYSVDKHQWRPSLIPGAIVLISTHNSENIPNIAPKSWLQMVSFDPPILMFSGTEGNPTENNILATGDFAINLVDSSQATKTYNCVEYYGEERIAKCGFTLTGARKIGSPLINECKAHLECRLSNTKKIGSGFVIFGEIVAASIWDKILDAPAEDRYKLLDQIVFLEEGRFSRIDTPYSIKKKP